MCLNPKWIYKKGHYKENNYNGMKGEFYEIGTYSKCGSCEICQNEKCNNWVVRNYYEQEAHKRICFVTLTYENSPYILVRKDFQDWKKRFRIELDRTTGEKVRFFEVGEYGSLRGRPHAHFIIYGWTDENPKYLGINKNKQILYQSKIIQKTWGLGRTSYQTFGEHEIPYITLYETPQDLFKRAYKLNREKVKKLREMALNSRMNEAQRKNLMEELKLAEEQLEDEKKKYVLIKEYNSWSQSLGWEEFFKEYSKQRNYAWVEYIEGKEFVTPSPWVKRLANMGFMDAIEEMRRRENLIQQSATDQEEKGKNLNKIWNTKKNKIIKWNDKKQRLETMF